MSRGGQKQKYPKAKNLCCHFTDSLTDNWAEVKQQQKKENTSIDGTPVNGRGNAIKAPLKVVTTIVTIASHNVAIDTKSISWSMKMSYYSSTHTYTLTHLYTQMNFLSLSEKGETDILVNQF